MTHLREAAEKCPPTRKTSESILWSFVWWWKVEISRGESVREPNQRKINFVSFSFSRKKVRSRKVSETKQPSSHFLLFSETETLNVSQSQSVCCLRVCFECLRNKAADMSPAGLPSPSRRPSPSVFATLLLLLLQLTSSGEYCCELVRPRFVFVCQEINFQRE